MAFPGGFISGIYHIWYCPGTVGARRSASVLSFSAAKEHVEIQDKARRSRLRARALPPRDRQRPPSRRELGRPTLARQPLRPTDPLHFSMRSAKLYAIGSRDYPLLRPR